MIATDLYLAFVPGESVGRIATSLPIRISGEIWKHESIFTGGVFYDYITGSQGLVGVRFWLTDDGSVPSVDSVWSQFAADPRVEFVRSAGYVDLWALPRARTDGNVSCDAAQDFGGDLVLGSGNRCAIAFKLPQGIAIDPHLLST